VTGHEFDQNPHEQAVMLGEDLTQWNARMDNLMAQNARIITIRGAGTVNGIDPHAARSATAMLHEYVSNLSADGTPVALMFDGDEDNRQRPDVGSVFGSLVDSLQDNPNVTAICAQTQSRYYPKEEGGALTTASGNPYETYVFDDKVPGSHAVLTQSKTLANYPGYEQVFVGPAGQIAYDQLKDLSQKATAEPVKVAFLKTAINQDPAIDAELTTKLEATTDEAKRGVIQGKLNQHRRQPYGALIDQYGFLAEEVSDMPGVRVVELPVHEIEDGGVEQAVVDPHIKEKKMDRVLQKGTPDQLKGMLDRGEVSVNQADYQGRTALMLYSAAGRMDAVNMVLERGANVNTVYTHNGRIPMTALDAAMHSGNPQLVDKLRSLGAKTGRELQE